MYAKKLITINILRILQRHSDAAHPISQKEIIKYLKDEYGMEVDRKAVRRNIDFLIDAGYEIKPASPEKKRMMPNAETGEKEEQPLITDIYLVRDFSDAELRMLIDSVLFSGHIPHSQRKELAEKLEGLSMLKTLFTVLPPKDGRNATTFFIDKIQERFPIFEEVF